MRIRCRRGPVGVVATSVMAASLVLVACSASSNGPGSSGTPSGGTKHPGGTVVWAEPPGSPPNYIFPIMPITYATFANVSQFQYLMYRPLYFFGVSTTTRLNTDVSLAFEPIYTNNDTQAVVKLKRYVWSDRETLTAQDVVFFMNLLHAQKINWYDYVPGTFPDNVTNITVNSPTQLTFTFDKPYDPLWMTDNEFSQVTPLPWVWDIKATGDPPGSGGCFNAAYGTDDAGCTAVYNYLNAQAANPSSYASNPLWQTVDGPWKLKAFDATGNVTMVPNISYSGPVKPTLSQFREVPFAQETAEFAALLRNSLDVGYIPTTAVPESTSRATVAGVNNAQLSSRYSMNPWVLFSFNYFPVNFNSTGDNGAAGALFRQLYIRQALQSLEDQPLYIKRYLKGYGVPTYGPVPILPANPYTTRTERNNPYPYDPAKARRLLSSHGWKIVPGGTDVCDNPGTGSGRCGAGIPAGTPLDLTLEQASGVQWEAQVVAAEKSAWSKVGIHVTVHTTMFSTVLDNATPCSPDPGCTWQMEWWGSGWLYSPDQYPTGDVLFATGALSNSGSYSDPTADALVKQTSTSSVGLAQYENYIATQLPWIWQPNADYLLTEIRNNLRGVVPQNPFGDLLPENWYFVR